MRCTCVVGCGSDVLPNECRDQDPGVVREKHQKQAGGECPRENVGCGPMFQAPRRSVGTGWVRIPQLGL
eukprot:scaffold1318_cov388-Prasinococcus_capsulatus_cf.AAC.17